MTGVNSLFEINAHLELDIIVSMKLPFQGSLILLRSLLWFILLFIIWNDF
jgi:hypothetical protein